MLNVFYPMNHELTPAITDMEKPGSTTLANLGSMMSIGILTDRHDIYQETLNYVQSGKGNGAFRKAMWHVYPDAGLAQVQESGRDQGHSTLDIALIGVICQAAWNQGDDLFSFNNNLVLKADEYLAKYNLGYDVPWTYYMADDGNIQTEISSPSRGFTRPIWTRIYNHHNRIKGLDANYTREMMEKFGPEAGAYGVSSGGFDQLGYGALLFNSNVK